MGAETKVKSKLEISFDYNGAMFKVEVPPNQQIEGAWHRALAHFGIRPEDAGNLGLYNEGNLVDRAQSFDDAGIPSGATLQIRPLVQRSG